MSRIELSLSGAAWLIVLLLLACLAISYLYYRNTLPPVSTGRRTFLVFLRFSALSFAALMLLEPLVRIVDVSVLPPTLAVLIDDSGSMSLGNRPQQTADALAAVSKLRLPGDGMRRFYLFGPSLSEGDAAPPESLSLRRDATNIATSLSSLASQKDAQNVRAVLLLTDGSSNSGESPAYEAARLGLPVYTIGIGDSIHPRDIAVTKVNANQTVHEGVETPVDVTIRSSGFPSRTVEVSLFEEETLVDRTSIRSGEGTLDYTAGLAYTPTGEGVRHLSVRVSPAEGELTTRNNRFDFFVRVLKGRLNALMVAGEPSPDVAAVREILHASQEFSVVSRTGRRPNTFYEGPLTRVLVDSSDCLILVGFPGRDSKGGDLDLIRTAIGRGKPALFIAAPRPSQDGFRSLAPLLGLAPKSLSASEELVFFNPLASHRNNPLVDPAQGAYELWQRLPPLYRTASRIELLSGGTILAVPRVQGVVLDDPLFVTYDVPPVRTASLLGYGVWRWRLMGSSDPDTGNQLGAFLESTLRWLTTGGVERGLRVQTSREFYPEGEPVEFVAQAYDATAQPVENASVRVSVSAGSGPVSLPLSPIGGGRYESPLYGLPPGEYHFTAGASLEGEFLGSDSGRFSIGQTSLEFRETRMDAPLLRRIAFLTGGRFVLPGAEASLEPVLDSLKTFGPERAEHTSRIELWHWPFSLALVILFFAAEWFIRKQSGMT